MQVMSRLGRVSATPTAGRIADGALARPVLTLAGLAFVAVKIARAVVGDANLEGHHWLSLPTSPIVAVRAGGFLFHPGQPLRSASAYDWPIIAAGAILAAGLSRFSTDKGGGAQVSAAGVFALEESPLPPQPAPGPPLVGSRAQMAVPRAPDPCCLPLPPDWPPGPW